MLEILEKAPLIPVRGGLPLKTALAKCPQLRAYLIRDDPPKIDLENREALCLYNTTIAKEVFGLNLHLKGFSGLIPTPVLRYNFLKHLNPQGQRILEVGTGYTALISMLAAKCFKANCTATEINPDSVSGALHHISINHLAGKITVILALSGMLLAGVIPEGKKFDLIITNPPYYYTILSPRVIWAGNPDELLVQKDGQENFCVQFFREVGAYLEPQGSAAMLVSGKQTQVLAEIFAYLESKNVKVEVVGLKAGTRVRWLIRAYAQSSDEIVSII